MAHRNPAELVALLGPRRPLIGLDPGEKAVGVALSDPSRSIATPFTTLPRRPPKILVASLRAIVEAENVGAMVLGLPLNMDGTAGPSAQAALQLGANLQRELGIPVAFWDERLSTAAVTRTLLEADTSRRRRAEVVDKLAAAYILQGALDSLRGTTRRD